MELVIFNVKTQAFHKINSKVFYSLQKATALGLLNPVKYSKTLKFLVSTSATSLDLYKQTKT